MFHKHHPVIYFLLVIISYYTINHGQRIYSLKKTQNTLVQYKIDSQLQYESLVEKAEENEQMRELVANAHLYIASLENQMISIKEDLKQCARKKLEE
jgi:hypothetical protein